LSHARFNPSNVEPGTLAGKALGIFRIYCWTACIRARMCRCKMCAPWSSRLDWGPRVSVESTLPPPTGIAGQFAGALFLPHYLAVILLIQVFAGILLIANRLPLWR